MLRAARSADADALARLFLAARRAAMPYLPELHSDEETRWWMAEEIVRTHEVVVAELDGRVAGFAAFGDDLLAHLCVDPSEQGRGIGSALLERAKEARPDGFRLWVFQRNEDARRFYENRGCRLVEMTDGAANEEREPDALYEWRPASPS